MLHLQVLIAPSFPHKLGRREMTHNRRDNVRAWLGKRRQMARYMRAVTSLVFLAQGYSRAGYRERNHVWTIQ